MFPPTDNLHPVLESRINGTENINKQKDSNYNRKYELVKNVLCF